jgi:hypothetical protein
MLAIAGQDGPVAKGRADAGVATTRATASDGRRDDASLGHQGVEHRCRLRLARRPPGERGLAAAGLLQLPLEHPAPRPEYRQSVCGVSWMCLRPPASGRLADPVAHDVDEGVRASAFLYLDAQREVYSDRIPWRPG